MNKLTYTETDHDSKIACIDILENGTIRIVRYNGIERYFVFDSVSSLFEFISEYSKPMEVIK